MGRAAKSRSYFLITICKEVGKAVFASSQTIYWLFFSQKGFEIPTDLNKWEQTLRVGRYIVLVISLLGGIVEVTVFNYPVCFYVTKKSKPSQFEEDEVFFSRFTRWTQCNIGYERMSYIS